MSTGEGARKRYCGHGPTVEWTEELWQQILANIRMGFHVSCAASAVGVTSNRLSRWLEDSERMREEVQLADEEAHFRLHASIISTARGDGKFALQVAERRYPQVWKQQSTLHIDNGPELAEGAMEKLDALIASTQKAKEGLTAESGAE